MGLCFCSPRTRFFPIFPLSMLQAVQEDGSLCSAFPNLCLSPKKTTSFSLLNPLGLHFLRTGTQNAELWYRRTSLYSRLSPRLLAGAWLHAAAESPALPPVAPGWAFCREPGHGPTFHLGLSVGPVTNIWLCLQHSSDHPSLICLFFDNIF